MIILEHDLHTPNDVPIYSQKVLIYSIFNMIVN